MVKNKCIGRCTNRKDESIRAAESERDQEEERVDSQMRSEISGDRKEDRSDSRVGGEFSQECSGDGEDDDDSKHSQEVYLGQLVCEEPGQSRLIHSVGKRVATTTQQDHSPGQSRLHTLPVQDRLLRL